MKNDVNTIPIKTPHRIILSLVECFDENNIYSLLYVAKITFRLRHL